MVEHRRRCGWGTVLAAVALFATVLLTVPAGPATATATASAEAPVAVIVRHTAGAGPAAGAQVRRLGGTVGRRLGRAPVVGAQVVRRGVELNGPDRTAPDPGLTR